MYESKITKTILISRNQNKIISSCRSSKNYKNDFGWVSVKYIEYHLCIFLFALPYEILNIGQLLSKQKKTYAV